MKVKVSTSVLIEKVAVAKKTTLHEHKEAVDAFPALADEYRAQLVKALDKALRDAKAGKPFPPAESHYWRGNYIDGVIIDLGVKQPTKPAKPDTSRYDKRMKELRLTSATELSVDSHDNEWRGIL